jgi:hypothetical protein
MKIKARGWRRNMGTTDLADFDLADRPIRQEENKPVNWNMPGLFSTGGEVSIAWGKKMHLGGDYRMQIDFSHDEVAQMFRAAFGSQVTADILEKCGLTLSPELQKSALAKVKVADLTLGDLAKMVTHEKEEPTQKPAVVPFIRRRV